MPPPSRPVPREDEIDWSRPVRMTVEEYLDFEEHAELKHEYADGLVIPLGRANAGETDLYPYNEPPKRPPGSAARDALVASVRGAVRAALDGTAFRWRDAGDRDGLADVIGEVVPLDGDEPAVVVRVDAAIGCVGSRPHEVMTVDPEHPMASVLDAGRPGGFLWTRPGDVVRLASAGVGVRLGDRYGGARP